jgi:hypothetical protein
MKAKTFFNILSNFMLILFALAYYIIKFDPAPYDSVDYVILNFIIGILITYCSIVLSLWFIYIMLKVNDKFFDFLDHICEIVNKINLKK